MAKTKISKIHGSLDEFNAADIILLVNDELFKCIAKNSVEILKCRFCQSDKLKLYFVKNGKN